MPFADVRPTRSRTGDNHNYVAWCHGARRNNCGSTTTRRSLLRQQRHGAAAIVSRRLVRLREPNDNVRVE